MEMSFLRNKVIYEPKSIMKPFSRENELLRGNRKEVSGIVN